MARKNKGCVHYLQYKRTRSFLSEKFGAWKLVEVYTPKRYTRMVTALPWLKGRGRKFPELSEYQIRRIEH